MTFRLPDDHAPRKWTGVAVNVDADDLILLKNAMLHARTSRGNGPSELGGARQPLWENAR